jgi:hypothetical protein
MGWRQFDTKFQHHDMFKMALHLFTHALELPGIGTPIFQGRSVRRSPSVE